MNVLSITLAVVLFLGSIALHEMAHLKAMQREGILIKSAGLGLPLIPMIKVKRQRPDGGHTTFHFSPWLIGGYVQPETSEAEVLSALPYRRYAWIMGAGVVTNIVYGAVLLALAAVIDQAWWFALGSAATVLVFWLARKFIAAYVVPVLGVGALAYLFWSLVAGTHAQAQMGIVGMGKTFAIAGGGFIDALILAGLLSIIIGVINMAPLIPFDGGQLFGRILEHFHVSRKKVMLFEAFTLGLFAAMVVYSLATDLLFA